MILEPHEEYRIIRALLSFELNTTPSEIDALPIHDVHDLLVVYGHLKALEQRADGNRRPLLPKGLTR